MKGPYLILFHFQARSLSEVAEITDNILRENGIG